MDDIPSLDPNQIPAKVNPLTSEYVPGWAIELRSHLEAVEQCFARHYDDFRPLPWSSDWLPQRSLSRNSSARLSDSLGRKNFLDLSDDSDLSAIFPPAHYAKDHPIFPSDASPPSDSGNLLGLSRQDSTSQISIRTSIKQRHPERIAFDCVLISFSPICAASSSADDLRSVSLQEKRRSTRSTKSTRSESLSPSSSSSSTSFPIPSSSSSSTAPSSSSSSSSSLGANPHHPTSHAHHHHHHKPRHSSPERRVSFSPPAEGGSVSRPSKTKYHCKISVVEQQCKTPAVPLLGTCATWQQSMCFTCDKFDRFVVFSLFSKEKKRKSPVLLGQTLVPLRYLMDEVLQERTVPVLSDLKRGEDLEVVGHIAIRLQLTYSTSVRSFQAQLGYPMRTIPVRLRTGDLIFVSSKRAISFTTKMFTNSKWDHVGMVVQVDHELYFLEAVNPVGVRLSPLEARVFAELQAGSAIAYRRLQFDIGTHGIRMIMSLRRYLGEVLGKPYESNPLNLIRAALPGTTNHHNNNNNNHNNNNNNHNNTNNTNNTNTNHHFQNNNDNNNHNNNNGNYSFTGIHSNDGPSEQSHPEALFCSELVASAYQQMGVLSREVVPHKCTPATFAGDSLRFMPEWALLPLTQFSRHSLKISKPNRISQQFESLSPPLPPSIPTPLRSTTSVPEMSSAISSANMAAAVCLSEDESSSEGSALGERLSRIGAAHSLVPTAANEEKPASALSDMDFSFTLINFIKSFHADPDTGPQVRAIPQNVNSLVRDGFASELLRDLFIEQIQVSGAKGFQEFTEDPLEPPISSPVSSSSSLSSSNPKEGSLFSTSATKISSLPDLGPTDMEIDLLREKLKLAGARGFLDPGPIEEKK